MIGGTLNRECYGDRFLQPLFPGRKVFQHEEPSSLLAPAENFSARMVTRFR